MTNEAKQKHDCILDLGSPDTNSSREKVRVACGLEIHPVFNQMGNHQGLKTVGLDFVRPSSVYEKGSAQTRQTDFGIGAFPFSEFATGCKFCRAFRRESSSLREARITQSFDVHVLEKIPSSPISIGNARLDEPTAMRGQNAGRGLSRSPKLRNDAARRHPPPTKNLLACQFHRKSITRRTASTS